MPGTRRCTCARALWAAHSRHQRCSVTPLLAAAVRMSHVSRSHPLSCEDIHIPCVRLHVRPSTACALNRVWMVWLGAITEHRKAWNGTALDGTRWLPAGCVRSAVQCRRRSWTCKNSRGCACSMAIVTVSCVCRASEKGPTVDVRTAVYEARTLNVHVSSVSIVCFVQRYHGRGAGGRSGTSETLTAVRAHDEHMHCRLCPASVRVTWRGGRADTAPGEERARLQCFA